MVGAVGFEEGAFFFRGGGGDDARAERFAEIDGGQSHAACRAMHQQPLALLQLGAADERHVTCEIADGETCGFGIAHAVGHEAQCGSIALDFLGIATDAADDHAVANLHIRHSVADSDHVTRGFGARREGEFRLVLIFALDGQDVGEIHRRRADAHARFARAKRRQRHLFQFDACDVVGESAADDRLHAPAVFWMPVCSAVFSRGWVTCGMARTPPRNKAVAKSAAAGGSMSSRSSIRSATSKATPTMEAIRKSASTGGNRPLEIAVSMSSRNSSKPAMISGVSMRMRSASERLRRMAWNVP